MNREVLQTAVFWWLNAMQPNFSVVWKSAVFEKLPVRIIVLPFVSPLLLPCIQDVNSVFNIQTHGDRFESVVRGASEQQKRIADQ